MSRSKKQAFMKKNPIREYLAKVSPKIQLGSLISGIVLTYMFIITIEAVVQNYQINKEIVKLKNEIVYLQQEKTHLNHLIAYLKTESFKEKEARRKLGYQKPGEQVVALPRDSFIHTDPGVTSTENNKGNVTPTMTNPQKWFDYIFG
ncbi:MAG: septum formation initiator family protein [Patescibacteria group bacterium]|nr:septum formation initiator family protein [Patescibacteria group bacterium]